MPSSAPERPSITWLGHATVLVDLCGVRLLTDPVLRGRVLHLHRHTAGPAKPERLDAVLVSHAHRDHLDVPSLRRLPSDTPVIAAPGAGRFVRRAGLPRVREMTAGDEVELPDGTRVTAVPAVHDGRRHPLAGAAEALGFVVDGLRRVYFAGDTEVFDGMRAIGDRLDAALLPVWGWGPRLGAGHMNPEQAAHAAALLRPAIAVPIHWGTFLPVGVHRRHPALLSDPGPRFAEHAARLAPGVRVVVVSPGDSANL